MPGLLKLWVATPKRVAKCNLEAAKEMAWQIRYTRFCKLCKKTRSRPAL